MGELLSVVTAFVYKNWSSLALFMPILFLSFFVFVGLLLLGVATGVIFPKRIGWISAEIEQNPVKSFLWGLFWILMFVPISLMLIVSIIGIPLIIGQILVYGVSLAFGFISAAQLFGKNILCNVVKRYNQPIHVEIIWGICALTLIGIIPVIGILFNLAVIILGIGASYLSGFGEGINESLAERIKKI